MDAMLDLGQMIYSFDGFQGDDLKRKIDQCEQFLLVETLPAATYHHAHLPGAINLPPDQVAQLAPTLLPGKSSDIVVYCAKPT